VREYIQLIHVMISHVKDQSLIKKTTGAHIISQRKKVSMKLIWFSHDGGAGHVGSLSEFLPSENLKMVLQFGIWQGFSA